MPFLQLLCVYVAASSGVGFLPTGGVTTLQDTSTVSLALPPKERLLGSSGQHSRRQIENHPWELRVSFGGDLACEGLMAQQETGCGNGSSSLPLPGEAAPLLSSDAEVQR